MAEKLIIDNNIIGTTADNVEYDGWGNIADAKSAVDDLHERLSTLENGN